LGGIVVRAVSISINPLSPFPQKERSQLQALGLIEPIVLREYVGIVLKHPDIARARA
jgi:hypothetical protein